jgi:hypothetical protein
LLVASENASGVDLELTISSLCKALGLALQLGPASTEKVLRAILGTSKTMLGSQGAGALAVLSPALVNLVAQVRESGVLPETPTMEAWATVVTGVSTLISQVGLAYELPPERRSGMLRQARGQAELLDDATGSLLQLTVWLDGLPGDSD